MNKRCCFAGHSKICYSDEIYDKLLKTIEKLITEENVSEFWVGNYGSFDGTSAKAVRNLKEKYPDIKLNLVVPYLTPAICIKIIPDHTNSRDRRKRHFSHRQARILYRRIKC